MTILVEDQFAYSPHLTIEQWDEDEFEASVGKYVNEYEFSYILPREQG